MESLSGVFQKLETIEFVLLAQVTTMVLLELLCKETLPLRKGKSYVWQLVNKAKVREAVAEVS